MPSLFKPSYTTSDPKVGRKIRRKAKKWYGQYKDGQGILRRVPLATDKTAAQQMLNELVKRAEFQRIGIVDPFEDHRKRPLAEHLADFEAYLRNKGDTEAHARKTLSRARRVVQGCGFRFIADMSASAVQSFLAALRRTGKSIGTANHYPRSVKSLRRGL